VLSANEELQSTNEELETAKEELQSTNEELTTLNEELQNATRVGRYQQRLTQPAGECDDPGCDCGERLARAPLYAACAETVEPAARRRGTTLERNRTES